MQCNSHHHSVASGVANSDKTHQATDDWRRSLIQLSRTGFGLAAADDAFSAMLSYAAYVSLCCSANATLWRRVLHCAFHSCCDQLLVSLIGDKLGSPVSNSAVHALALLEHVVQLGLCLCAGKKGGEKLLQRK